MIDNKITLMFIGGLLIICLMVLSLLFILDTNVSTNAALRERVTWLEDKMIERVKPIIQINRATIYNTEGEIVVEELDKR